MADVDLTITLLNLTIEEGDPGDDVTLTFTSTNRGTPTTYALTIDALLFAAVTKCLKQMDLLGNLPAALVPLARDETAAALQDVG